ncbi:MAG: DUF2207 domain-containing protein [Lachnospiraceae bacterium]|nr:DUF2207 domain-containing protein [Lachnospiraceae bacterium]
MANKIISVIYTVFLIFIFLSITGASDWFSDLQLNPFDYARITELDYRAEVVDEPFDETYVHVTERITFDIHAASRANGFRELWRDLPEDETDGLRAQYQVRSVTQILPDGGRIPYPKSPQLYWEDEDYEPYNSRLGPGKWFHSPGPYDESRRRYECVFFYVNDLYREKVVYELEYDLYNTVLKYNDCCDLYLYPYYGSTIKYLESFNGEVLIADKDMPSEGNYDVFTYGTKAESFPVEESDRLNPGYHTFYFNLDKDDLKFRTYNSYLEFELVAYNEDYSCFADNAPDNLYSDEDVLDEIYEEQQYYANISNKYRVYKQIVLAACVGLSVLVVLLAKKIINGITSKHIFYTQTEYPEYYRDIPSDLDPNFAAFMVFSKDKKPKDDSGVYSALLLSLARKKYITLSETHDDVHIKILQRPYSGNNNNSAYLDQLFNGNPSADPAAFTVNGQYIMNTDEATQMEPLTPCEEFYFNLLIRQAYDNNILMSEFQNRIMSDYENSKSFVDSMKNSIVNIGISEKYFQKMAYDEPKKHINSRANLFFVIGLILAIPVNLISYQNRLDLAFGGYTILAIACILSALYMKKEARKYILFTYEGEMEYAKWRGLYNFLNSETLMNERTIIELPVWEKYLVYATAFGLSEKIIEAIKIRCPEFDTQTTYRNSGYHSRHFYHRTGHRVRSSVRSGSSFSSASSYYGGGRDGGGGGGGH